MASALLALFTTTWFLNKVFPTQKDKYRTGSGSDRVDPNAQSFIFFTIKDRICGD
jgi:hypothetical protein